MPWKAQSNNFVVNCAIAKRLPRQNRFPRSVKMGHMMSGFSPLIKTHRVTALPCHRVSSNYEYSSGHDIKGT
ncbi:hypothetical protein [Microseira wollei]|uniref:hypothetical protein n=1 Tax=Microseira wollei TaxID=467598 RepID=UPI001CFE1675|nr:hypothetical protein [Microseira wollei]